jgi:hypothetical protein
VKDALDEVNLAAYTANEKTKNLKQMPKQITAHWAGMVKALQWLVNNYFVSNTLLPPDIEIYKRNMRLAVSHALNHLSQLMQESHTTEVSPKDE